METESHLLDRAIRHINRASELANDQPHVAVVHADIANAFRNIAHEVRVGRSKRKYAEINEDAVLAVVSSGDSNPVWGEWSPKNVFYVNDGTTTTSTLTETVDDHESGT